MVDTAFFCYQFFSYMHMYMYIHLHECMYVHMCVYMYVHVCFVHVHVEAQR